MPLDKDQIKELRMMSKLSLKKAYPFFYCEADAEGEPVLVIGKTKSVVTQAKKDARTSAKKKIFEKVGGRF